MEKITLLQKYRKSIGLAMEVSLLLSLCLITQAFPTVIKQRRVVK